LFTPEAFAALTPERLRALRSRLEALSLPAALVATMEFRGRRDADGLRLYRYAFTDFTGTEIVTLGLTKDDKVASVEFGR
jgi:hypothetical protein